jgi:DinB family protein
MTAARSPAAHEYAPAFADYVGRVAAHEDVLEVLTSQLDQVIAQIRAIPESRGDYRYAPGKWSIKEVVGHLSDTERVFAYRALRIGRGDSTPLPSFDDQAYVREMRAGDRALSDLTEEWKHVRLATIALFRRLPAVAWERRGVASDQPISVRALAYVIAGHVRHHLETLGARYQV